MNAKTSLEEHIAHHSAAIDDISRQMADQWDAIRNLDAKLDRIVGFLKEMQEDPGFSPSATQRPPHY